jgi:hypothetical protein
MEDAEKFKTRQPRNTRERRRRTQEWWRREIRRRSRKSGVSEEEVERELLAEVHGRRYKVTQDSLAGAPFFDATQLGGQVVLTLNTAHRFFQDVYADPNLTPRLRAAIEILLFVIGEAEVEADDDRLEFYETERGYWSERLRQALGRLERIDSVEDAALSAEDEAANAEVAGHDDT